MRKGLIYPLLSMAVAASLLADVPVDNKAKTIWRRMIL